MISVGIDIVEVIRIEKILKRNKNFLNFILGKDEFSQLKINNFYYLSVAANFCGKEAFLKSLGLGIFSIDLRHIQIIRNKSGCPELSLSGKAQKILKEDNLKFSISLTHTKTNACAVVICEK